MNERNVKGRKPDLISESCVQSAPMNPMVDQTRIQRFEVAEVRFYDAYQGFAKASKYRLLII